MQLNADVYETDPELEKIRKDHGYSYMDIITIHKDALPHYEEKVSAAPQQRGSLAVRYQVQNIVTKRLLPDLCSPVEGVL